VTNWLTIGEVAAILGVSHATARAYLDSGRLDEPVKSSRLPSGHRRAHPDSVERLRSEIYGYEPEQT
jgi:DNA-binding transcriptional MerR regulator